MLQEITGACKVVEMKKKQKLQKCILIKKNASTMCSIN